MIKPLLKLTFFLLVLSITGAALAQTGTMPGSDDKSSADIKKDKDDASGSFKFGVTYVSNNVYAGRADTVTTPVIMPEVKYTFKSGIFLSGGLFLLPDKPKKKLDGGDLQGGYDFDITESLSGGASFAKYFYSPTSTQVSSSISGTFNVNFDYDIEDIITPNISADCNLNKGGIGNDVLLTPGLSHDFITIGILGDKDILLISPTISANMGTQNFYDAYLTKKNFKSAKRTAKQNALLAGYVDNLGRFELLDYELSAPLEYKSGHFIFLLVPIYAIVQNQLPKMIAARLDDNSSMFYLQAGVSLKF